MPESFPLSLLDQSHHQSIYVSSSEPRPLRAWSPDLLSQVLFVVDCCTADWPKCGPISLAAPDSRVDTIHPQLHTHTSTHNHLTMARNGKQKAAAAAAEEAGHYEWDYLCKFILIGDSAVGKSALLLR